MFDLLAVQGTIKSLLQHHSSKASILQHSAFFVVQLPHLYMTTRKTIALTIWNFVGKVTSLFNTLSRFVIAFLPISKCLLISWLQSPSAVILEPKKIKSDTVILRLIGSSMHESKHFTVGTGWPTSLLARSYKKSNYQWLFSLSLPFPQRRTLPILASGWM